MSKYIKNLISGHVRERLNGVNDLLLVNVIGMKANSAAALRKKLRESNIQLMVIKNSMAARATDGSGLAPAFEGASGTLAIVWGAEDIVSLAKQITKLTADPAFPKFEARGGVMDGSALTADGVVQVSKWKSRTEQLSIIAGQILSPGAKLSAQLLGPGAKLNSQLKKKGEGADGDAAGDAAGGGEVAAGEAPAAEAAT
jgi:large subunit ribosomal protein L10